MDSKIETATLSAIWPYLVLFVISPIVGVIGCQGGPENSRLQVSRKSVTESTLLPTDDKLNECISPFLVNIHSNIDDIYDRLEKLENHSHPVAVDHEKRIKALEEKSDGLEFGININAGRIDDLNPPVVAPRTRSYITYDKFSDCLGHTVKPTILTPKPKEHNIVVPKKRLNIKPKHNKHRHRYCNQRQKSHK